MRLRRVMKVVATALALGGCVVQTPLSGPGYDAREGVTATGEGPLVLSLTAAVLKDDDTARDRFWAYVDTVEASLPGRPGLVAYAKRTELFGDTAWTMVTPLIRPVDSATGMNSPGGTVPSTSSCQRARASMATLAEMAGVSIGSLYQYFPDKSAVIRALAERCYAESRHCIAEGLAHVSTAEEVGPAFAALIDEYYEMFLAAPAICDIWAGTQADKSLQELEVSESRENGAVLAGVLARLNPKADRAALQAAGFLIMQP